MGQLPHRRDVPAADPDALLPDRTVRLAGADQLLGGVRDVLRADRRRHPVRVEGVAPPRGRGPGGVMTAAPPDVEPVVAPRLPRRVPGIECVWVLIAGDMVIFALLFGSFMSARLKHPDLFEASRHALDYHRGGINTLLLLTSSWC